MQEAMAFNGWASRFLWPFNLPKACPAWSMVADSASCAQWVMDFQASYGLAADGRLGPSTLHACAACFDEGGGGVGGAMIGGEEVDLGVPVARMCTMARQSGAAVGLAPRVVLFSTAELERHGRHRRLGERGLRGHFSVDAAQGRAGASLVLQWADPKREVSFVPSEVDGDYPASLQAIGVELENALVPQGAASEARKWLRRREGVAHEIGGRKCRHLAYFPEQVVALQRLMQALQGQGVPVRFPQDGAGWDTRCRPGLWSQWEGYLARFHYAAGSVEPGAGLVEVLPALFGPLAESAPVAVGVEAEEALPLEPPALLAQMAEERRVAEAGSASAYVPQALPEVGFRRPDVVSQRGQGATARAEKLRQRLLRGEG